jgi:hypothetical protein
MQKLYFEVFISFAALFFIHEHLKLSASAFHDFNKAVAYRYSTIIY